jgi:hypothetical protein
VAQNPLISAGIVNRLLSSITWQDHPELNVTPPFMSRPMVRFAREGNSVVYLPTATSAAASPEPYMMVTLTVVLLKTQALAASYEAALRTNSLLGEGTVRPDVSTGLGAFDISNCAIETPGELSFDGSSVDYPVSIRGIFPINSGLFP